MLKIFCPVNAFWGHSNKGKVKRLAQTHTANLVKPVKKLDLLVPQSSNLCFVQWYIQLDFFQRCLVLISLFFKRKSRSSRKINKEIFKRCRLMFQKMKKIIHELLSSGFLGKFACWNTCSNILKSRICFFRDLNKKRIKV